MKRLVAALILLVLAVPAQARLIKEMEVTRSGKVVLAGDVKPGWYQLVMDNNKVIVLGDRSKAPDTCPCTWCRARSRASSA